jgi:hypothetical protein
MEADLVPKPPAKKAPSKKRDASPEASSSNSSSRNVHRRGGLDIDVDTVPAMLYSTGTHPNQRGGWLPYFHRSGGRGGGGRGRGRNRNFY